MAVCLLPGTEVAFDRDVMCKRALPLFPRQNLRQRMARFRQVNMDAADAHHDALEFPDGKIVMVTNLVEGQRATVLQLPVPVCSAVDMKFSARTVRATIAGAT